MFDLDAPSLIFLCLIVLYVVWSAVDKALKPQKATTWKSEDLPLIGETGSRPAFVPLALQYRLADKASGQAIGAPLVKEIQVSGSLPDNLRSRLRCITSVLELTEQNVWLPVTSSVETFREPRTACYQWRRDGVLDNPGSGWASVGEVHLQALAPSYGGRRTLAAVLRLVDPGHPPTIEPGRSGPGDPGVVAECTLPFDHEFRSAEPVEPGDERPLIVLQLAMVIAMLDLVLTEAEGTTIKAFLKRTLEKEPEAGPGRDARRSWLNQGMTQAYQDALRGDLPAEPLMRRLQAIPDSKVKYDAVELCFDVLMSGRSIDRRGIDIVNMMAGVFDLDRQEFEKLRDRAIARAPMIGLDPADVEALIDIKSGCEEKQRKKSLQVEYAKWSNRLSALKEGSERSNAQRMLDVIAEARKRRG